MLTYHTYTEVPTLDSFTLGYSPQGLSTVLISPWFVANGASGATYNSMRSLPGAPRSGMSTNFGCYRANNELDGPGPLHVSFRDVPAVESYTSHRTDDAVVYAGPSFSLEARIDGWNWRDAAGRIDVQATRLGDACTFWVPAQPGIEHPLLSRSHMGFVTGHIDDDPIEGLMMVDHIYTTPGVGFVDSKFMTDLHHYWMNWMVEYDDGSREGGFAWRGQPGTGFAAAHHWVDGQSYARSDARLDIERTEGGTMKTVTLGLGQDIEVEFAQHGSFDWPIHTHGTAVRTSRDKQVVRSWNYSENFPTGWGKIETYQRAHADLFGRYPSLKGILESVTIDAAGIMHVGPPKS